MKKLYGYLKNTSTLILFQYLLFIVCIALLLSQFLCPVYCPEWLDEKFLQNKVYIILTTYVFYLFFRKTQKLDDKEFNHPDQFSGLKGIYPNAINPLLKSLMKKKGKKMILNTWILKLSDIKCELEESLKNSKTEIEIIILDPKSEFVLLRANELNQTKEQILTSIKSSITELTFFKNSLPENESNRVQIFTGDYNPKFSLYANNNEGLLGFFWPSTYAIHGPHFHIKGKNGYLTKKAWKYVNDIPKKPLIDGIQADNNV